jgi:hypothetical protein
VGIREAGDLTGITGIGEYLLIAGEAGVENNFAAATRMRASRATVKDSSVL